MALNDYVWAKMKYFPPWPGKVTKHPEGIEKKGRAYVFFYGTHDFAFIEMANIMPYNSALPKHHRRKMYQMAVEEIQQIINDPTKEVCKSIRVCKNKTLGLRLQSRKC
ncbi:hypothetical protein CDAR_503881 [Caerostris darwini]|uniref:PWWP domain-containing protein n=1 Tax=Caerostris darwini TaxID=1538125 RepID=A0AAV4PFV5_9ARAC|nr:hypothetical protein CDAR_503881 [Caerostris darwini]